MVPSDYANGHVGKSDKMIFKTACFEDHGSVSMDVENHRMRTEKSMYC